MIDSFSFIILIHRDRFFIQLYHLFMHLITIGEPIPSRDLMQFGMLDIDINVGINLLDTHKVKITCKDCKASLRGERRPHTCFYEQSTDKRCSLMFAMKANRLLRQASIEYWCMPTTFSLYIPIFAHC